VAFALSSLIAALGVLGLVLSSYLENVIRLIQEPTLLYVAAGIRLVLGSALIVVANESRAPGVLKILGGLLVFSGITIPILGVEHIGELVNFFLDLGPLFLRIWGAVALLLGGSLIFAITPEKRVGSE
jgi:ABC-type xylose transport system permease subunit